MSALLLLATPILWLAAFRLLVRAGVDRPVALVAAAVAAVVLAATPAYLLRTMPSHGSPVATPYGPLTPRADRPGTDLQVDFGNGWQPPSPDRRGQDVRWMGMTGEIVVGPLGTLRPPADLIFEARSLVGTVRLTARLGTVTVGEALVRPRPRRFWLEVPGGEGPAVLELSAASEGQVPSTVLSVSVQSLRAIASAPR